jgi:hypothetical protein
MKGRIGIGLVEPLLNTAEKLVLHIINTIAV